MTQTERRRLLKNINRLVRQSSKADVKTMATVLNDLGSLYSEYCGRKVTFLAVCAEVPGNQEQLDNFKTTVLGTNQEQTEGTE